MLLAPENANSDPSPYRFLQRIAIRFQICWLFSVCAGASTPPLFEETEVMVNLVWVVRVEVSGELSEFQFYGALQMG
jgi:hypothetical protein